MDSRENDGRSLIMIITSMLIFGTIGIFRRAIPFSSGFLAFWRGLSGGLFLILFLKLKGRPLRVSAGKKQLALLTLSGAVMGINWILLFEAYTYTSVSIATLCYYMEPTIVLLLSPVLFGEKLTGKKILCAVTAFIGMILVSGAAAGGGLRSSDARGVLLALGAAALYALVVILNKKTGAVNAWEKTIIQLFSAAVIMIPYLLAAKGIGTSRLTFSAVLLLLIVGIVHTGAAYALYFGSISGLKAQTIAIISYIDPVSALLFSAVFLRESLSPAGIIGAVLIIGSAVISETRG